jgi:Flp pilus assembly protein TadB
MAKLRRFLVEVIAFAACLLIGAAVFQAIEYRENESANSEAQNSEILEAVAKNISQKYNISAQEMNYTVQQLRRAVRNEGEKWDHWDFTGCYFFAGTVAFTIGKAKMMTNYVVFCGLLRLHSSYAIFIRAYTHVKVEFALHPTYEITKFIKGQHSVLCMISCVFVKVICTYMKF